MELDMLMSVIWLKLMLSTSFEHEQQQQQQQDVGLSMSIPVGATFQTVGEHPLQQPKQDPPLSSRNDAHVTARLATSAVPMTCWLGAAMAFEVRSSQASASSLSKKCYGNM